MTRFHSFLFSQPGFAFTKQSKPATSRSPAEAERLMPYCVLVLHLLRHLVWAKDTRHRHLNLPLLVLGVLDHPLALLQEQVAVVFTRKLLKNTQQIHNIYINRTPSIINVIQKTPYTDYQQINPYASDNFHTTSNRGTFGNCYKRDCYRRGIVFTLLSTAKVTSRQDRTIIVLNYYFQ